VNWTVKRHIEFCLKHIERLDESGLLPTERLLGEEDIGVPGKIGLKYLSFTKLLLISRPNQE
jgi:hypothetical protein